MVPEKLSLALRPMEQLNDGLDGVAKAASSAAKGMKRFSEDLHDAMNAAATHRALLAAGYPRLARFFG